MVDTMLHDSPDLIIRRTEIWASCLEVTGWAQESLLFTQQFNCYIWYSDEGTGWGCNPPRPLFIVPNVTAHLSTASVPITESVYCAFICGFNVPIKWLIFSILD